MFSKNICDGEHQTFLERKETDVIYLNYYTAQPLSKGVKMW